MLSIGIFVGVPKIARGDEEGSTPHVEPPPEPREHPARPALEIHGAAAIPLENETICPSGAGCVLGLGMGLGVQVEWRSADRVGLFVGYDFLLLDSNSVFELAALHTVRAGVRYIIDDDSLIHPFIEGGVGGIVFGETTNVVAFGGLVSLGGGMEIELSESVAFVSSLQAWFLSTSPFRTREGALRSDPFGVNVALQVTLGVSIQTGSLVAR